MMNNLESFSLDLPLKGQRNYLQSADIYHGFLDKVSSEIDVELLDELRFIFRKMNHGVLTFEKFDESRVSDSTGSVLFGMNGEVQKMSIFDSPAESMRRVEFDEDSIVACCELDPANQSVTVQQVPELKGFRPMELVVAANKLLHQTVFADAKGKWLFTETKNSRPLIENDWGEIQVTIVSNFGTKLTKAEIRLGQLPVGYICFSLLPS